MAGSKKRLFAARHPEPRLVQRPVAVCGYNLIDVTGNSADQINAGLPEKIVERFAHRTADDNLDAERFDFAGAFVDRPGFHWDCAFGHTLFSTRFQQAQRLACIQNRRNPSIESRHGSAPRLRCRPNGEKPARRFGLRKAVMRLRAENAGMRRHKSLGHRNRCRRFVRPILSNNHARIAAAIRSDGSFHEIRMA